MTQPTATASTAPADAAPVGVEQGRARRLGASAGATLALAAVAVTATGSPAHADEQYTVRQGDTVSHIAVRTGASVQSIARANALADVARIRVGQQLTIPSGSAAAAPTTVTAASAGTHTVASGETVSKIAARYGTTVQAVVAANGLDSRALIRIGQQLSIPGASSTPATTTAAPTTVTAASAAGTHTVASGETVSKIAARYGTTVQAVVAANGLDSRALIRIGQQLSIPGAAPAATSTTVATTTTSTGTASHTVASGETVSKIAARYGTTVQAVIAANGLDSRALIRIGQQLTIPGQAPTATVQLVGNTFAGRTYADTVVASANANKATLLAIGVPSKADMQAKVAATARSLGVDPSLALAVAFQESGFNHTSVSPANAIGTMQVIPSSGEWASQLVGRQLNLLDPDDNVVAGVAILRSLVKSAPDLPTAIAGYYQGASSVKRNGMYADTRRYVANIQTHMTRFR